MEGEDRGRDRRGDGDGDAGDAGDAGDDGQFKNTEEAQNSRNSKGSTEAEKQKQKQKQKQKKEGAIDPVGLLFWILLLPWFLYVFSSFAYAGRLDLWPVLAGLLLFQACNSLIYSLSASLLPPLSRSSSLDNFTNISVSLLHSAIVGISVASVLVSEWNKKGWGMFDHEELFSVTWSGSKFILCFSSGYFAYDQVDMLRRRLYTPSAPSLLVHHVVLLVCFTMALHRRVSINYLILTLFCEVHSIFLHLRRVLKMGELRREESWLVVIEWTFNWLAFFTTRLAAHVLITIKLVLDFALFPRGVEWPLAMSGMLGLNILNAILGFDLWRAFGKDSKAWQRRKHCDEKLK